MKRHRPFPALLSAVLLGGCLAGPPGPDPIDPKNPEDPEEVQEQGELLFVQHCSECHGEAGEGSERAFQIQNPVVNYATFVIRNGRDSFTFEDDMPAFPPEELSDDEMNSIIFFLRQAPKPTDGAGLFARFCANCHGENAIDGIIQEDIVEEAKEKPEDVFETVREGEGESAAQRFEYMPPFSEEDLTDEEVNLIIDFLRSL